MTSNVWAIPDRPVNDTATADRRIFAFCASSDIHIARTPVVISNMETNGRTAGESIKSKNSAKTENKMTYPPTLVRTAKLSMIEWLTEARSEPVAESEQAMTDDWDGMTVD